MWLATPADNTSCVHPNRNLKGRHKGSWNCGSGYYTVQYMDTAFDMVVLEGNRVHDLKTGKVLRQYEEMSNVCVYIAGVAPRLCTQT